MASAWASFLGALLGAVIGAVANLIVGEGKRRRDEDTALLSWCTQVYAWVVDGKVSPAAARDILYGRRVQPRWWKFNKRHARTIEGILQRLDEAFTPAEPPDQEAASREVFELEEGE